MDQRTTDEYNQRQDRLKESFQIGEYAEEHLAGGGIPVRVVNGRIVLEHGYADAARARKANVMSGKQEIEHGNDRDS